MPHQDQVVCYVIMVTKACPVCPASAREWMQREIWRFAFQCLDGSSPEEKVFAVCTEIGEAVKLLNRFKTNLQRVRASLFLNPPNYRHLVGGG